MTDSNLIPTTVEVKHQNISVVVSAISPASAPKGSLISMRRPPRCGEKPLRRSARNSKRKLVSRRKNISASMSPSPHVPQVKADQNVLV